MAENLRKWSCRHCGRSNSTVLAANGRARCDFCANETSVQPSRRRGGETQRQLPEKPGGVARRAVRLAVGPA